MHLNYPLLFAFRLPQVSFQMMGSGVYKNRNFDRGTATSAFFLAIIGLSMSMFSLKQMQSTHQRRLRS